MADSPSDDPCPCPDYHLGGGQQIQSWVSNSSCHNSNTSVSSDCVATLGLLSGHVGTKDTGSFHHNPGSSSALFSPPLVLYGGIAGFSFLQSVQDRSSIGVCLQCRLLW